MNNLKEIKVNKDLKELLVVHVDKIKKRLNDNDKTLLTLYKFIPKDNSNNELENWVNFLTLNDDRSDLEKFYIYKFAVGLGLYHINDCDLLPEVFKYFEDQLNEMDCTMKVEKQTVYGRTIKVTLNDESMLYLDTDTGYSLARDANLFLTTLIKDLINDKYWWNKTYVKRYEENEYLNKLPIEYNSYKYFYFYELASCMRLINQQKETKIFNPINIQDEYPIIAICNKIKEYEDIYSLLIERAKLTHTLTNMILIPKNTNTIRNSAVQDDMYKTIQIYINLKENKELVYKLNNLSNHNYLVNNISINEVEFLLNNNFYVDYEMVEEGVLIENIKNRTEKIIDIIHLKRESGKI